MQAGCDIWYILRRRKMHWFVVLTLQLRAVRAEFNFNPVRTGHRYVVPEAATTDVFSLKSKNVGLKRIRPSVICRAAPDSFLTINWLQFVVLMDCEGWDDKKRLRYHSFCQRSMSVHLGIVDLQKPGRTSVSRGKLMGSSSICLCSMSPSSSTKSEVFNSRCNCNFNIDLLRQSQIWWLKQDGNCSSQLFTSSTFPSFPPSL